MLRRLKVENYALIDRLELELDDRLNIITGETGAGKSILLGALGLLLGNKNDNATLKDDKRNCLIEGVFDLGTRDLQAFFDRNDLDYSRETTLTRQITPAGKSRSFINDTPVPLALLRELGSQLIDIHSQHQNLILGSEAFRTQAVDTVAENHDLRMQYTTLYERLCHLRRELARLREEAEAGRKDEEWLRYQVEELAAAHLKEGEQTELEQELEVLSNADRISETLTALRNALDDEQIGVLVQLKASETACRHLEAGYPFAAEAAGRLRSVLEELKDLGASAAAQSERLDADPERLQNRRPTQHHLLALPETPCRRSRRTPRQTDRLRSTPASDHARRRSHRRRCDRTDRHRREGRRAGPEHPRHPRKGRTDVQRCDSDDPRTARHARSPFRRTAHPRTGLDPHG